MKERVQRILAGYSPRTVSTPDLVPASVLMLLFPKDGEYHVLFTKRTERVKHHKGEISFPGGARDDGDESPLATALRETQEEVGIDPRDVEVLGPLDQVRTRYGYKVTPFVGDIPYPYPFVPREEEVSEVLEVPISTLVTSEDKSGTVDVEGQRYHLVTYRYGDHVIWGATAKMVERFLDLCYRPSLEGLCCDTGGG